MQVTQFSQPICLDFILLWIIEWVLDSYWRSTVLTRERKEAFSQLLLKRIMMKHENLLTGKASSATLLATSWFRDCPADSGSSFITWITTSYPSPRDCWETQQPFLLLPQNSQLWFYHQSVTVELFVHLSNSTVGFKAHTQPQWFQNILLASLLLKKIEFRFPLKQTPLLVTFSAIQRSQFILTW